MNILDENIPKPQRELLESWRIHVQQIAVSIGQRGMSDEDIIPLLQKSRRATFFTRDADFYKSELCHVRYCIVFLAIEKYEVAAFVKRFLPHPEFKTKAKRLGKVIRLSRSGISCWHQNSKRDIHFLWEQRSTHEE